MFGIVIPEFVLKILFVVAVLYATYVFERFALRLFNRFLEKKAEAEELDRTVAAFVKVVVRVLLWIIVTLFVLQNLGFQITALLGGLGVAGLAAAFAFQKILEDVFSFFLIYFDKPFRVGDYIVVGNDMGTVKNIGMRMTRLDTPNGQELLISNRELTNARLQNFKRMQRRRALLSFTITYGTSLSKVEQVKTLVAEIFTDLKQAELDRIHLKELADSGITFEAAYYVASREFKVFMDVQEQVNLALLKTLAKQKIDLAYPTQTIELKK